MDILFVLLTGFLGVAISISAIGKIKRIPGAVESLANAGVKPEQFNKLAVLEILGSLGLFLGIWMPPIGAAAAIGIALYFIGAQTAHMRMRDTFQNMFPATFLFLISAAVVIFQLKR
ncbi:MAG: hypothetical protein RL381_467 [Actinomycetota bacterium]|jgi:uncharacterized membrane protein YphA (DoxX/SURF4 family)